MRCCAQELPVPGRRAVVVLPSNVLSNTYQEFVQWLPEDARSKLRVSKVRACSPARPCPARPCLCHTGLLWPTSGAG